MKSKNICVNLTCVGLRKRLSLAWLLNVIDMLLVRKDALKYINSAKKWIYINIFKGKEKIRSEEHWGDAY